ncbi:MAG: hypothetical protein KAI24_14310 [Planctomycetes bacterium]|nr:hypothetical protein [Planctomycetota bacterium]
MAATGLRAQFAEAFDSQATADVTIVQQPDTFVTFVDYSNMTVGGTTWSIPEAPRPISGSAPTRGVLIQCNLNQGFAAGVNLIAGLTPIQFSGRYRLSFDAWINVPIPLPSGGTEQLLWGCGVDNILPIEARNNRGAGTAGIWGWLAGENGYSTEDACINNGDLEIADLGDLQPGEDVPFNEAFDSNAVGGPNGCAANTWVRVDIDCDANGVRVYFNGVEFFNDVTVPPTGFAMIGYEDPFSSISASPDGQWGLLDNFRVTTPNGCGTLGTAIQQGTSTGGEILNGSAPPAISAPLSLRLRGGPVNSIAFLAAGQPSPVTLPVPLNPNCTINVELVTLDALLPVATNADGGAVFTLEIPDNPALCGSNLGWQYLTLDPANPQCPFLLTEGLTTTFGS